MSDRDESNLTVNENGYLFQRIIDGIRFIAIDDEFEKYFLFSSVESGYVVPEEWWDSLTYNLNLGLERRAEYLRVSDEEANAMFRFFELLKLVDVLTPDFWESSAWKAAKLSAQECLSITGKTRF